MTPLPVIGVPVRPANSHLDGVDALLSICQMPKGVPVGSWANYLLSICQMPKGVPVGSWANYLPPATTLLSICYYPAVHLPDAQGRAGG